MPPKASSKPVGKKRVAANGHKLPDPIREGEVLRDIQKRQWRLGKSIGVGGFGEIYAASDVVDKPVGPDAPYVIKIEPHSNGPLFVEMNFYIRVAKAEMIEDWMKSHKLKFLGMPRFVGSGSHEYRGEKYRFMVMQRFGTDIQKLFETNNRRFPLNTVLNLGLKIIDVLEYIHDKQYVHADIKGSNLLLGFGKGTENQIWLVDFGLACRYTNDGVHKEYKPDLRKAHNGTIEFTSRDAHIGANSRRGDFEILGYNLLQWCCGRLPWEDKLTDTNYVAEQKNKFMNNIPLLMQHCFSSKNHPIVIEQFLQMVAKLRFEEKPNYDKFRQLLKQGLQNGGYLDDGKLIFSLKGNSVSPVKRLLAPTRPNDEPENINSKKQQIVSSKRQREPCAPKNSNRTTRNKDQSTINSNSSSNLSDTSIQPESTAVRNKKSAASDRPSTSSVSRHEQSLSNPTPAMLAILERMRNREETPPNVSSRKKQARLDSRSCSPTEFEPSSVLTPAMEEVIRIREIRKSMEQSAHFFTPVSSPSDDDSAGRRKVPSSTPINPKFELNVINSSSEESGKKRKISNRKRGERRRPLRLQSSITADTSTASETSPRKIIFKRKYKTVTMATAATQTSPGVLNLPSVKKAPYALRSTQGQSSRKKPPPVIDLSPDIF